MKNIIYLFGILNFLYLIGIAGGSDNGVDEITSLIHVGICLSIFLVLRIIYVYLPTKSKKHR